MKLNVHRSSTKPNQTNPNQAILKLEETINATFVGALPRKFLEFNSLSLSVFVRVRYQYFRHSLKPSSLSKNLSITQIIFCHFQPFFWSKRVRKKIICFFPIRTRFYPLGKSWSGQRIAQRRFGRAWAEFTGWWIADFLAFSWIFLGTHLQGKQGIGCAFSCSLRVQKRKGPILVDISCCLIEIWRWVFVGVDFLEVGVRRNGSTAIQGRIGVSAGQLWQQRRNQSPLQRRRWPRGEFLVLGIFSLNLGFHVKSRLFLGCV